jgi:hypothetical protein
MRFAGALHRGNRDEGFRPFDGNLREAGTLVAGAEVQLLPASSRTFPTNDYINHVPSPEVGSIQHTTNTLIIVSPLAKQQIEHHSQTISQLSIES